MHPWTGVFNHVSWDFEDDIDKDNTVQFSMWSRSGGSKMDPETCHRRALVNEPFLYNTNINYNRIQSMRIRYDIYVKQIVSGLD